MLIKMLLMFCGRENKKYKKTLTLIIHVYIYTTAVESEIKINTIIIIMELKTYCTHKSQVRKHTYTQS